MWTLKESDFFHKISHSTMQLAVGVKRANLIVLVISQSPAQFEKWGLPVHSFGLTSGQFTMLIFRNTMAEEVHGSRKDLLVDPVQAGM